ncbi:MAG TPA: hypothetical protein VFA20_14425 [Myxococcaceae bacterium]|nr:hypothetical protein [Myxococcaceae bacterium]
MPADEPADSGDVGDVGPADGGDSGEVGGVDEAGGAPESSTSSSEPTEVQRDLQQDQFEPAAEQSGGSERPAEAPQADARQADVQRDEVRRGEQHRDEFEASARRPSAAPAPQAQAPAVAQERQRDRFEVNISPENRAHLQRQAGEISQKWNQFTGWAQRTGDWFRDNVPGVKQLNDAGAAIGDFAADKTIKAAQATGLDKVQVKVPDAVLDAADAVTKPILSNGALMNSAMVGERVTYGVGMEAAGTVEGLHSLATTNPIDTAKALGNAVANAPETAQQIKKELTEAWDKDPAELIGRAGFEIGSFFIPGGQAKEVVGAAEAAEHVGQAARLAHGVEELGEAGRVANGLEHAGQVSEATQAAVKAEEAAGAGSKLAAGSEEVKALQTSEEAGTAAGRAGEAGRTTPLELTPEAREALAHPPLTAGSPEYRALADQVAAKEELAQRLRGTLDGRLEVAPGRGRSFTMSGAGDMDPASIRRAAEKLESDAAAGRARLAGAERPDRIEIPKYKPTDSGFAVQERTAEALSLQDEVARGRMAYRVNGPGQYWAPELPGANYGDMMRMPPHQLTDIRSMMGGRLGPEDAFITRHAPPPAGLEHLGPGAMEVVTPRGRPMVGMDGGKTIEGVSGTVPLDFGTAVPKRYSPDFRGSIRGEPRTVLQGDGPGDVMRLGNGRGPGPAARSPGGLGREPMRPAPGDLQSPPIPRVRIRRGE